MTGARGGEERKIKPQPSMDIRVDLAYRSGLSDGHGREIRLRYGSPGDRLAVREATEAYQVPNFLTGEPMDVLGARYCADGDPVLTQFGQFDILWWSLKSKCSAATMPREAVRLHPVLADV